MWEVYELEGCFHVLPKDDLMPHAQSKKCWCKPGIDDDRVIHHAADKRELAESELNH